MKITGELLKTERLKQELRIQDIASSLKLSSKIITSIEAGDIENLPPKTFVRGFVKNYAHLLKLDVDMVLRQFQEEMGSTNPLPKISPPKPAPLDKNIKGPRPALKQTAKDFSTKNATLQTANLKQSENPKKIILMVSIAIVLIIVLVVSNKVVNNLSTNPVAITPAEDKSATAPTVSEASSPSTVSAPSVANSSDTQSPKATTTEVNPKVATQPEKPTSTHTITAQTPPPADSKSPSTPAKEAPVTPGTPEAGFEKSSGKPVEILLEAKKDTELFYARGDSKEFVSLKLNAKQIQILRSNVGLYLKAANGASFKISVNGVEKGFSAGENKPVKLTF